MKTWFGSDLSHWVLIPGEWELVVPGEKHSGLEAAVVATSQTLLAALEWVWLQAGNVSSAAGFCSLAAPACLLQPVNRRWQCLFSRASVGGRAQPGKTSPAPSILWEWQWAGITMLQLRTAVPLSALAAFSLITWILGIPQSHWVLGCSSTFARLIHLFSRRDLSLCFSHDSIF